MYNSNRFQRHSVAQRFQHLKLSSPAHTHSTASPPQVEFNRVVAKQNIPNPIAAHSDAHSRASFPASSHIAQQAHMYAHVPNFPCTHQKTYKSTSPALSRLTSSMQVPKEHENHVTATTSNAHLHTAFPTANLPLQTP